jgi:hypothetical protein
MNDLTETRERFLRAIVADVPADRVAEVHFFPPIKQGGIESGVAVVAAWPEVSVVTPPVADAPVADPSLPTDVSLGDVSDTNISPSRAATERHVVYTARYRHTLKGPDRGKWETNVVAEADAPLVTVDAVVRGVQRRSGDVDDPTKMDGDEVRAFVLPSAAENASGTC